MKIIETKLPGVVLVQPRIFGDARGFFLETHHQLRYQQHGIHAVFVQDNHSRSQQGVIRGLHCQQQHSQGKLVTVTRGQVLDVVIDIRLGSPTFGEHISIILDDENHLQLYLPPGFAHGFCVLSETADFTYKCTEYYHPEDEVGIRFDDPDLGIAWPIKTPSLSEKDANHAFLKDIPREKLPKYVEAA